MMKFFSSKHFWHLVGLVLVPFLVFLPIALRFGAITMGDHELIAKLSFIHAIKNGDPLWWTEALYCGTFLLGTTSVPMTLGDLAYFVLSPRWAHNFSFIFDIVIAGVGFYLWRVRSWKSFPPSTLVGAFTYQLSLYVLSQAAVGHQVMSTQYAWFPWMLWSIDQLIQNNKGRFVISFPWILFAMAMATYPSTTIVLVLTAGIYLLWRLGFLNLKKTFSQCCLFAFAGILGFALTAFVYLPATTFLKYCVLPGDPTFNIKDYAYHLALPVPCLATFFTPYIFGGTAWKTAVAFWANFFSIQNTGAPHEFAVYCGLIPLWLFWTFRKALWKINECRFWVFITVLLLIVSFGKWGGLYMLFQYIPILKSLRGPTRFVVAIPMALACIAVLGSEIYRQKSMDEQKAALKKLALWVVWLILFSFLVLLLAWGAQEILSLKWSMFQTHWFSRLSELLQTRILIASYTNVFILCIFAIAWGALFIFGFSRAKYGLGMITCLVLVDLIFNAYPMLWKPSGNYAFYLQPQALSSKLLELTAPQHTRFVDINYSTPHNLALINGTRDVSGFKDFALRWNVELIRKVNGEFPLTYDLYEMRVKKASSKLFSLMRVDIIASNRPISVPGWSEVDRIPGYYFYRGPSPVPEAWLPEQVSVKSDALDRLNFLEEMVAPQPTRTAVVESEDDLASKITPPAGINVRMTSPEGLHYQVHFDKPAAGVLCTAIGYYPDWKAFHNGQPLPLIRVNHAFIGVKIDQPITDLEIKYVPSTHILGIKLSIVALAMWILSILALRFKITPLSRK